MQVNGDGLKVLRRAECQALLASVFVGRLGASFNALPIVVPAAFITLDDIVVFRTSNNWELMVAADRAVVAFEAGRFDDTAGAGWSVVVQDVAHVVNAEGFAAHPEFRRLSGWANPEVTLVGVLPATNISGVRVAPAGEGQL